MTNLKCYFLSIAMCAVSYQAFCQKHDYVWLQGYDSYVGFDSGWNYKFGTSVFDFNYNPRQIRYDSLDMNFSRTNTSYCDNNGNLMFYTNGIYVANALDEKIENGDSLNAGAVQYWWDPMIQDYGYRAPQGIVALQSASSSSLYYLIHTYWDTITPGQLLVKRLYYTSLDMALNGGHGKVLEKNKAIVDGNLGAALAVVRHANGRDWWVMVQKRNTNCYYKILLGLNGPTLMSTLTCGGNSTFYGDVGNFATSPDGSKLAYFSLEGGVNIFDFDRCNGELSNAVSIAIPGLIDSGWISEGAAISPNSRFLYISCGMYLFQYDLWAADIAASVDTIGIDDGIMLPFWTPFFTLQLGPDGKIYGSTGNTNYAYHVVERPDEKGDSCLLNQHGLILPSFCFGPPFFPNYRLGALSNSPCDTLTSINDLAEKEKQINIYPNPATDFVVVDYGFTDWSKGDVTLEIINNLGQVVYQKMLPRYSGFHQVDLREYPSGMYSAIIKRNGKNVAVGKFVKE